MRKRTKINVDCPVCGFRLRGSASEGFRCIKCHTHYGTAYVRSLRRRQFKDTIHKHFVRTEPEAHHVEVEQESRVIIDDFDKAFQKGIEESFKKADERMKKLEEVVADDSEYVEISAEDFLREVPPIMIEKRRPEVKEYSVEHVPVKKSSRKKVARKASKKTARKRSGKKPNPKKVVRKKSKKKSTRKLAKKKATKKTSRKKKVVRKNSLRKPAKNPRKKATRRRR